MLCLRLWSIYNQDLSRKTFKSSFMPNRMSQIYTKKLSE